MGGVRWMGLVVVATGMLFGACGNDTSNSGGSAPASSSSGGGGGGGGQTIEVSESEFKLAPANPSVSKVGTVTIQATNDGSITHALEVEGPGGEVKTGDIQPGKSTTLKADLSKAGTYEWYCPIDGHKAQGMKGEIKVAGGGSGKPKSDDESKDDSGGGGGGGGGY
jgi:plastocyanin